MLNRRSTRNKKINWQPYWAKNKNSTIVTGEEEHKRHLDKFNTPINKK